MSLGRAIVQGAVGGYAMHVGGDQREDMRNRDVEWWRDWLARDPLFSPQPYT